MDSAGEEDGRFGAGGLSSDEEVERFLAPDSLDPEALRYGVGESPPPPAGTQPLHSQQGEPRDEAAAELADLQAWGFDGYERTVSDLVSLSGWLSLKCTLSMRATDERQCRGFWSSSTLSGQMHPQHLQRILSELLHEIDTFKW